MSNHFVRGCGDTIVDVVVSIADFVADSWRGFLTLVALAGVVLAIITTVRIHPEYTFDVGQVGVVSDDETQCWRNLYAVRQEMPSLPNSTRCVPVSTDTLWDAIVDAARN